MNAAPTVTAAFSKASVSCGADTAALNVTFTDPDPTDTHSAVVDWGDGKTEQVAPATSPLSLAHTYAKAGPYTATIAVTDDNGNAGIATAGVVVEYTSSGFLPPVNPDGTSVFKYSSTVPVKIRLQDCDGSYPANLAPTIKLTLISGAAPGLPVNEPIMTGSADTSGVMRWSGAPDNQYIYNLGTKALADSTGRYEITVTVPATGQTAKVKFGLK